MKKLILTVLALSVLFSACHKKNENSDNDNKSSNNYSSRTPLVEMDGFYYFIANKVRKNEDPYTHNDDDLNHGFLYFYDNESKSSHALCSRPDCFHLPPDKNEIKEYDFSSEETCNAYLGINSSSGMYGNGVLCSDGEYIYTIASDQDSLSIVRFSFDGGIKEKVTDIGKFFSSSGEGILNSIETMVCHNNSIFYNFSSYDFSIDKESKNGGTNISYEIAGRKTQLFKYDLKSRKTPDLLYERETFNEKDGGLILGLLDYRDDRLTFSTSLTNQESEITCTSTYLWNEEDNKLDTLFENAENISEISVSKDGLNYIDYEKNAFGFYSFADNSFSVSLNYNIDEKTNYLYYLSNNQYIFSPNSSSGKDTIDIYDKDKNKYVSSVYVEYSDYDKVYNEFISPAMVNDDIIIIHSSHYLNNDIITPFYICNIKDLLKGDFKFDEKISYNRFE